ncbi:hypothetical protein F4823DRAFT_568659 [Ustulina deusta]|nr:hypothetical protein F4823DRAFT_568659 [Ustulina deusta]
MARRPKDNFRGEPIGDGGREIIVDQISCPMVDGLARDAFRRKMAEVQSYVQRLLQEKRQEWEQGGRVGPRPSQQRVEAGLFGSGEDSNIASRKNQMSRQAWVRLTRAGVYPLLAHLLHAGRVGDSDLHHAAVNQLGATSCKAYSTKGWDEMVGALGFVDDILSYRSRAPTADNPGPRDGTNIRHTACAYKGNVKVVLLNAAIGNDASAGDNEYNRNQILDDLNSQCDQSSPNRIIVSTYRICGMALNLQRANYSLGRAKLLLEIERDCCPITLNRSFYDILQEEQGKRFVRTMDELRIDEPGIPRAYPVSPSEAPEDEVLRISKSSLQSLALDKANSEHRFVDVVCQQAVNYYLLAAEHSLLEIFNMQMVLRLDGDQLDTIAGEDLRIRQRREKLTRGIANFEAALKVLKGSE